MAEIISKPSTREYREGWERIFGGGVHFINRMLDRHEAGRQWAEEVLALSDKHLGPYFDAVAAKQRERKDEAR